MGDYYQMIKQATWPQIEGLKVAGLESKRMELKGAANKAGKNELVGEGKWKITNQETEGGEDQHFPLQQLSCPYVM
jgi:hypothetical protein